LKRRYVVGSVLAVMLVALFALSAFATDSEMYFASDSNGANRVTNIQEGDEIWIAVYDPDENIDCDVRDKIWTEVKIMDPKTGAYIVWISYDDDNKDPNNNIYTDAEYIPFKGHYPGDSGSTTYDYLEETGADTGLFVSKRTFQVGTRESFSIGSDADKAKHTHVVGLPVAHTGLTTTFPNDFQWGHYLYDGAFDTINANVDGDVRGWFTIDGAGALTFNVGATGATPTLKGATGDVPSNIGSQAATCGYLIGRFENMDTLVGLYQDPNDAKDVACAMGKIIDTEAVISWDQEIYKDANASASVTVVDPDENVNCNKVECVPVFIMVNPGSWNVQSKATVANFCDLKRNGGYMDSCVTAAAEHETKPIRWYNIYKKRWIYYPQAGDGNVVSFDTTQSCSQVVFYACETGVNTGVFQLNLNSILDDLNFDSLDVCDVLVAYYLDPNDFDDFKLATAYIESRECASITRFTDATRAEKDLFWIGRDPVYVQVIDSNANVDPCCPEQVVVHICDPHGEDDAEWVVLDETSSNSVVFFTNAGMQLWPVWDALGIGLANKNGGYQLQLDNWKLEVFNEDSVYARYNDVYYTDDIHGMGGLGDVRAASTADTAFPPKIRQIRVDNDVSFDLMEIADTQVFDGTTTKMYFLDRQGNRVSGYVNSDCVFVEVIDLDQDEDQHRRERIDAFWDKYDTGTSLYTDQGQNYPFGPYAYYAFDNCVVQSGSWIHPVNTLLGDTNIFDTDAAATRMNKTLAKLYVLNPRNGRWASVDLMENGVASGDFVSVTCIDLASQYTCLATLGVLPGDTLVAVYQDPSNHSDSAWISIKVGCGGGGTPPGQASTTKFSDAEGNVVTTYTDADDAYVKVIDPSHAGADTLTGLEVEGTAYDLSYLEGANTDTFITAAIPMVDLGAVAGDSITATYTDATDPLDTSTDTVPIISSELVFESFIAKPNPFSDEVTFTFEGAGIPTTFAVTVYNMSGHLVWSEEKANVTEIVWDGKNEAGMPLANGPYIYVAMITDGTDTYTGKGKVFINK